MVRTASQGPEMHSDDPTEYLLQRRHDSVNKCSYFQFDNHFTLENTFSAQRAIASRSCGFGEFFLLSFGIG